MSGILLVITGSPRKEGVTARMARYAEEAWRGGGGGAVRVFNAYHIAAKPCIHCGHCKTTPACIYDDLDSLDAALKEAAALVIASPVYALGFPAPLKAIFDRMQRYFEEKFALGNPHPVPNQKPALFLCACGAKHTGLRQMTEQLAITFKLMNARLTASYLVRGTDSVSPAYEQIRRDITALAGQLRQ